MKEHIARIKAHIEMHPVAYSVACGVAIGAVAGITWHLMRGRHAVLQSGADGSSRITVRPFSFLSPQRDVVTTIHTGYRGHPGFRVRSLEFMTDYDTQADVARVFDISPSMLSSHLNGKIDNVNGLHFERIAA